MFLLQTIRFGGRGLGLVCLYEDGERLSGWSHENDACEAEVKVDLKNDVTHASNASTLASCWGE